MQTRRLALILALLTPLPGLAPRAALAALTAEQATSFVQSTGNQLLAVINGPGDPASKAQKLQPIIDAAVDVDEVGRFCLGRFWRMASPAQQSRIPEAVPQRAAERASAGKLGEYQRREVHHRPRRRRAPTPWWCRPWWSGRTTRPTMSAGSSPTWRAPRKIVDVIAEGTSLRVTQRSDYDSYLSRNGNSVTALIDAMRAQIAKYAE